MIEDSKTNLDFIQGLATWMIKPFDMGTIEMQVTQLLSIQKHNPELFEHYKDQYLFDRPTEENLQVDVDSPYDGFARNEG